MPVNFKPTPNPFATTQHPAQATASAQTVSQKQPDPLQKPATPQTVADLILQITQQNNQLLSQIAATQEQVYELQHKIDNREKYKIWWSVGKFVVYIVIGMIAASYLTSMITNMMGSLTGGIGGQTSELAQIMKEVNNSGSSGGSADTEAIIRELSNFLK